jgi:hypothetical protein
MSTLAEWQQSGRGFIETSKGGDEWKRIEIPAASINRITPGFLEEERRNLGESWYRQEYCCSFEALEGLVYPDFKRCVIPGEPGASATGAATGRAVGGIDFGFRNPFAAVWGVVDRDDILWLTGEHFCRNKPLSCHIKHLPRNVRWYADPAGAGEIDHQQRRQRPPPRHRRRLNDSSDEGYSDMATD